MNIYQEQILEHYHNPKNFGKPLSLASHSAKVQNLTCGDELQVDLNVKDDIITDINFNGEGCSISIASASLLSEKIKGMNINEIEQMSEENILDLLGIELTPSRLRCATLSLESVKKALKP